MESCYISYYLRMSASLSTAFGFTYSGLALGGAFRGWHIFYSLSTSSCLVCSKDNDFWASASTCFSSSLLRSRDFYLASTPGVSGRVGDLGLGLMYTFDEIALVSAASWAWSSSCSLSYFAFSYAYAYLYASAFSFSACFACLSSKTFYYFWLCSYFLRRASASWSSFAVYFLASGLLDDDSYPGAAASFLELFRSSFGVSFPSTAWASVVSYGPSWPAMRANLLAYLAVKSPTDSSMSSSSMTSEGCISYISFSCSLIASSLSYSCAATRACKIYALVELETFVSCIIYCWTSSASSLEVTLWCPFSCSPSSSPTFSSIYSSSPSAASASCE